jgi:hypothetical protein
MLILFYEYKWREENRAITVCMETATKFVQLFDRYTGVEIVGPWSFIGGELVGSGDLSDTRKEAIATLLREQETLQAAHIATIGGGNAENP